MSGTKVIPDPPAQPKCPQCGTPLPSGALAGFCPACLLKMGAATDTVTEGKQSSFSPPPIAELAPLFPQLEILELIGKGGMGAVYKARQKQLDRFVALKILPPGIGNDAAFAERFAREAKALAKLNHPGIVTLYEFGTASGYQPSTLNSQLFYFLMEFVDGLNLRQLLHAGRIAPREALAIVPQICDALQFAHDQGIVHRDIKPENILLDRRGRVKVADFGLAKIVGGNEPLTPSLSPSDAERVAKPGEGTSLTGEQVMGTPQYMSPEQRDNPSEVDHRADIYALGVVFYQMLTGELPGKQIEAPSKKVQIDVRLDEVVLRALEKKPERRYQQASVLKTQVETIAETPELGSSRREEAQIEAKGGPSKLTSLPTNRPGRVVTTICGLWTFVLVVLVILEKVGSPEWNFWVSLLPVLPLIFLVDFYLRFRKERQSNPSSSRREEAQTQEPEIVPRFSRTAIVGAGFGLLSLVMFGLAVIVDGVATRPWLPTGEILRNKPAELVTLLLILAALLCACVLTFFGWLAVSQIRRSAGKLYGMWLAVFDGLLFPLLALDGLVILLGSVLAQAMRSRSDSSLPEDFWPFTIAAILTGLLLDVLIVVRVWHAVNKPDGTDPAKETAENSSTAGTDASRAGHAFLVPLPRNRFWKWLAVTMLAAIAIPIAIKQTWIALTPASTRPQQPATFSSAPSRTVTGPPFLAHYPGGTIELVALAPFPATNQPCWRPDGSPSPEPFPEPGGSFWTADKELRLLAIRVKGQDRATSPALIKLDAATKITSIGASTYYPRGSAETVQRLSIPPNTESMNCSIGVADGDWETLLTLTPGTNAYLADDAIQKTASSAINNWEARVNCIVTKQGSMTVAFRHSIVDNWQSRLMAARADGSSLPLEVGVQENREGVTSGLTPFNAKETAKIVSFQLQRRVYQWVEFHNISLQPGHKTTVEVKDFGSESTPKPPQSLNDLVVKTIMLTRATNQWVGDSTEIQTASVWTDTNLEPGEALRARVKNPDGTMENASSGLFIRWKESGARTSTSFSWVFQGAFGEQEAAAAVAQIRERKIERPLALRSKQPLELFSVTNRFGGVMVGYVEFTHTKPRPVQATDGVPAKVRALVRIKRFTGYFPSLDYAAEIPPGYALRATASDGEAQTHTPAGPNEYSSTWSHPTYSWPRQEAQQAEFTTQIKKLQAQGPLEVVLGEPRLLFSLTNGPGDVYHGSFELLGPDADSAK